ncbi:unnamed protein product [Rotaria sp. Silwood1]|nr:unnamed protein product [Rotaria sp. Silwood1]
MAQNHSFDVEPSTTIRRLKELFCKKTKSEEDLLVLCFTFNNEELEEDKKALLDYKITEDAQLNAIFLGETYRANLGFMGSRFVDVSNSKGLKRKEWSKKAPKWRKTIRGLCLEGRCSNLECEAHDHSVIMRIGYKKFDILADPDESTTVCPICEQFVEPKTCAFNNCWWRYEGVQQAEAGSDKPPKKCSSEWFRVDDAYHYFDEETNGMVTWKRLVVEAVKDKPI